ncbi:MAG: hypothetical protein K0S47_4779 [Herbinix sp.]|nr:hypothetical protein [Herbinix sp.]
MNAIVMQKKPQIIAFSIERKIHHLLGYNEKQEQVFENN